jgi:hypothetical protein
MREKSSRAIIETGFQFNKINLMKGKVRPYVVDFLC